LDDNSECYHRVIYVFFCKECWKKNNALKILRVQLPQKSEFYNYDKLLIDIENDEYVLKLNSKIKTLTPEYIIDTSDEREAATRLYTNFYESIQEKSSSSKNSKKKLRF